MGPHMNNFVTVYLDDIIIYSKYLEEHINHMFINHLELTTKFGNATDKKN
ncbi:hypothetical protein PIROE2DRAFT_1556 [Piromyces sp. E2]|nr:hypothetical protein PIROE2DRAFT_1556 [Piromyces sp. E2]|eukprot:OUM70395.1 hypothetical protein PIROE2DRAFT_1556 [Piromyces sp. E2]